MPEFKFKFIKGKKHIELVCDMCRKNKFFRRETYYKLAQKKGKKSLCFDCRKGSPPRQESKVNKLKTVDRAYLAGMVDADGFISPKKSGVLNPQVGITNTHKGMLDWVKKTVGHGTIHRKVWKRDEWSDCFCWKLCGLASLSDFLKQIKPHMKIKDGKAGEIIKYADFRLRGKNE